LISYSVSFEFILSIVIFCNNNKGGFLADYALGGSYLFFWLELALIVD